MATTPTAHAHAPTVATVAHAGVTTAPRSATAPGAARPNVRTFFCRQCRRGVDAADPPDGWLRVQLHDAATQQRDGRTYVTVALLCGLPCLRAWATITTEAAV